MTKKDKNYSFSDEPDRSQFKVLFKLLKGENIIIAKNSLVELSISDTFLLLQELSDYIIAAPEKRIIHMNTLITLCESESLLVLRASLLSLTEVFKNICPLYQINTEKIEKQLTQSVSKDERFYYQFELTLIQTYEKFLKIIHQFVKIKGKNLYKGNNQEQLQQSNKIAQDLRKTSIKCLLEIRQHLSHFNFNEDITQLIVQRLANHDEEVLNKHIKK